MPCRRRRPSASSTRFVNTARQASAWQGRRVGFAEALARGGKRVSIHCVSYCHLCAPWLSPSGEACTAWRNFAFQETGRRVMHSAPIGPVYAWCYVFDSHNAECLCPYTHIRVPCAAVRFDLRLPGLVPGRLLISDSR